MDDKCCISYQLRKTGVIPSFPVDSVRLEEWMEDDTSDLLATYYDKAAKGVVTYPSLKKGNYILSMYLYEGCVVRSSPFYFDGKYPSTGLEDVVADSEHTQKRCIHHNGVLYLIATDGNYYDVLGRRYQGANFE